MRNYQIGWHMWRYPSKEKERSGHYEALYEDHCRRRGELVDGFVTDKSFSTGWPLAKWILIILLVMLCLAKAV